MEIPEQRISENNHMEVDKTTCKDDDDDNDRGFRGKILNGEALQIVSNGNQNDENCLSKFEILHKVDAGSYGSVKLAQNKETKARFALKMVLHPYLFCFINIFLFF